MKLEYLQPAYGSKKIRKRCGRGQASGRGGTSKRGHKGAKSRSGYTKKLGFEGGQMPLQRRVPKFGFKNFKRKNYKILNLDKIQSLIDKGKFGFEGGKIKLTIEFIKKVGLVTKHDLVKILGRGHLKNALKIYAHKCSKKAMQLINKAGGEIILIK